jgi:phosphohistidine phosphatase
MRIVLVHHAEAVGPDVDPQRPLSARGRAHAALLATGLQKAGFVPAAIWHSGKLRSRQTAEEVWRACSPFAEFRMIRGLAPDDPPEWVRQELLVESRDVALVGHMPHLASLARLLQPDAAPLRLHGAIGFETTGDGIWREWWVSGPGDAEESPRQP